jgi:hypothetical protein
MSVCNYTKQVSPNLCIGDSLPIFNENFANLDENLCSLPTLYNGSGIRFNTIITEQNKTNLFVSTTNSTVQGKSFDSIYNGVVSSNIQLQDSTTYPVTIIPSKSYDPYTAIVLPTIPTATFSVPCLTNSPASLTLFWTASGRQFENITVANYNVAGTNLTDLRFNGTITAFIRARNDLLYVGGEFTSVAGKDCKKFCIINTQAETAAASFLGNPLSAFGDLGTEGTVNAIAETTITYRILDYDMLIVGGSFKSSTRGRSLCIMNLTNGVIYPFYFNGTVNCVKLVGTELYVGGMFDYINYSAESGSDISGLRVRANGLAKISLFKLFVNPNNSIDLAFMNNSLQLFSGQAVINSIVGTETSENLYLGGSFVTKVEGEIVRKNLAIVFSDGTFVSDWSPIVGGDVYKLALDGDYLYVGGLFNSFHTKEQFYSNPRIDNEETQAHNVICFKLVSTQNPILATTWKPQFNGPVFSFAFQPDELMNCVFCYGNFTETNGKPNNYVAAIQRAFITEEGFSAKTGIRLNWTVNIDAPPPPSVGDLLHFGAGFQGMMIGGNFTRINNLPRRGLAKINTGAGNGYRAVPLSGTEVVLEVGAQVVTHGTSLDLNYTNSVRVSATPFEFGVVNKLKIPLRHPPYGPEDMLRIFIRRPIVLPGYTGSEQSIYVLGWKVEFN